MHGRHENLTTVTLVYEEAKISISSPIIYRPVLEIWTQHLEILGAHLEKNTLLCKQVNIIRYLAPQAIFYICEATRLVLTSKFVAF